MAAPVNTSPPVQTGGAIILSDTQSVTTGSWTDDGSPTFTYQWQRDGHGDGVYTSIAAATASTYAPVVADDVCQIRCAVTDTDTGGATTAFSNAITAVQQVPGTGATVQDITGDYICGSTVTAVPASWAHMTGYSAFFTFQWQISENGVSGWTDLPGLTAAAYTTDLTVSPRYLRSTVIGTNSGGTSATQFTTAIGPFRKPTSLWRPLHFFGQGDESTLSSIAINVGDANSIVTGIDADNRVDINSSDGTFRFSLNRAYTEDVFDVGANPITGDIYVASNGKNWIARFDKLGNILNTQPTTPTPGSGPGQFIEPFCVDVSPDGATVLASDSDLNRVQKFSSTLVYQSLWASGFANLRYAPDGTVWCGDGTHRTANGTIIADFSGGSAYGEWTLGHYGIDNADPYNIYFGGKSYIIISDQSLNVTGYIGGYGSNVGQMLRTEGIAVKSGRLYVADLSNRRIDYWTNDQANLTSTPPVLSGRGGC